IMRVVAGIDLGGTAINYTLLDERGHFLIEQLCEHPARTKEGPLICLQQMADGLKIALEKAELKPSDVVMAGLDTPGPASAAGVLSTRGGTNFVHADWAGWDFPGNLSKKLGIPVIYLSDNRHRTRRRRDCWRLGHPGEKRFRRGTRPRHDSLAIDSRYCGNESSLQLWPSRRHRIALLAY